jgi:hypothetical protein
MTSETFPSVSTSKKEKNKTFGFPFRNHSTVAPSGDTGAASI